MSSDPLARDEAPDPYAFLPALPPLTVESDSFADGAALPDAHAYGGGNLSPHLRWSGAPDGTASYLVSCFDPDAPTPSGFWHWCVVGLPVTTTELVEGAGSIGKILREDGTTLLNDFGTADFGGAAPPKGDRPHRYIFAVTALDTDDLGVDQETSCARAHFLAVTHALARGYLTGTYALD